MTRTEGVNVVPYVAVCCFLMLAPILPYAHGQTRPARAAETPTTQSIQKTAQQAHSSPSKSAIVYTKWPLDAAEARRRQDETAERLGIPVERKIDLGGATVTLVLIPTGEFVMGSPEPENGRRDHEGPPHRVRITKPYYLSKTEVTQAQWQAVMGNNPSRYVGERQPVENISWYDCEQFCYKLRASYDLEAWFPTEAQWEYACRAGTDSPFFTGATLTTKQANYDGDYTYAGGPKGEDRGRTTPVGEFSGNAWGLYDMHGNLKEWCDDRYDSYGLPKQEVIDDPRGASKGAFRVLRGGSFDSRPENCRSASRDGDEPHNLNSLIGLRIVLRIK